jgi:hypothetical protein
MLTMALRIVRIALEFVSSLETLIRCVYEIVFYIFVIDVLLMKVIYGCLGNCFESAV